MIHTTTNQSDYLLGLGLQEDSADLCFYALICDSRNNPIPPEKIEYKICFREDKDKLPIKGFEKYNFIPSWSFSRLLSIYLGVTDGFVMFSAEDRKNLLGSLLEKFKLDFKINGERKL